MNVKAFVFDLDGTLVDSKIDFHSMKLELQLSRDKDVLAHIESLPIAKREEALNIVYRHELAGAEAAVRIRGALEFFDRVRAAGKPCAIFTRNARSLTEACLRAHGFSADLIVAREDAVPKPKPDGLLQIARAFGVEARDLFFIGDYHYDLQAGLAAGVPTALFLPSEPDFETAGAQFLFATYHELMQRFFPD